ncbi:unnamed protein product [marine sediment metagenome]|uniref:Uncharacterized protein n=1 Tax=marine sediment metagenome TaxID=412755 RepID=X1TSF3_9ZZZZ
MVLSEEDIAEDLAGDSADMISMAEDMVLTEEDFVKDLDGDSDNKTC